MWQLGANVSEEPAVRIFNAGERDGRVYVPETGGSYAYYRGHLKPHVICIIMGVLHM
jgi:hypothetical protein